MSEVKQDQPQVAKKGGVVRSEMDVSNLSAPQPVSVTEATEDLLDENNIPKKEAALKKEEGNPIADFSDEQLKSFFEKNGIEYGGIEDLKKKLSPVKESAQETPEQKEVKDKAYEKRMIDIFTEGKGTIDQYAAIKGLANADVKELSQNEIRRELKEAGFEATEVDDMIKEMYMQVADDELDKYEDETEKDFLKRKKEFGSKLLENRALSIKQSAEGILNGLKSVVDSENMQKQEEEKFSSKIDEHFAAMPRTITFELGSANNRKIDPIEYEVTDKDIAEVAADLKDPAKRNNFYLNEEGKPNLENLAAAMLNDKIFKSALKAAYLTGETRNAEELNKVFSSRSPYGIGVGGAPMKAGQNGAVTQVGKPQRVIPSQT